MVTIYFYYLIYNVVVDLGHLNKFTTLFISLPIRLIIGLFKGLITSIPVTFYGFIFLLFTSLPLYWILNVEIYKDVIVNGTIFLFFTPYLYFIIKVFKEELEHYNALTISK